MSVFQASVPHLCVNSIVFKSVLPSCAISFVLCSGPECITQYNKSTNMPLQKLVPGNYYQEKSNVFLPFDI